MLSKEFKAELQIDDLFPVIDTERKRKIKMAIPIIMILAIVHVLLMTGNREQCRL